MGTGTVTMLREIFEAAMLIVYSTLNQFMALYCSGDSLDGVNKFNSVRTRHPIQPQEV